MARVERNVDAAYQPFVFLVKYYLTFSLDELSVLYLAQVTPSMLFFPFSQLCEKCLKYSFSVSVLNSRQNSQFPEPVLFGHIRAQRWTSATRLRKQNFYEGEALLTQPFIMQHHSQGNESQSAPRLKGRGNHCPPEQKRIYHFQSAMISASRNITLRHFYRK